MYAKDPYNVKYQFLISKQEKSRLNTFSFIKCSNDMNDLYKNIEEYSVIKKQKLLTIFYDIVADMSTNKNLNPIVIELLIKARKLKIYLAFITQF